MSQRNEAIVPRDGQKLVVGIMARISGCQDQKELSLNDQEDHGKEIVAELYEGPVKYHVIATKGKGERLDRPELAEIEALLRTGTLDLLVAEDIGRIVRGTEAVRLCGIAVDHGTRVIAPNDCIDTADDSWEEDVIEACAHHVGHNRHTSRRLKKKLMNRFMKSGGAPALPILGYIIPPGAKSYDDWQKDPIFQPIYDEWGRRLRESLNCCAVADWLNSQGIPTGPHCRRKTWTGAMVRRYTRNPLLKGFAARGFRHSIKHHESGRRVMAKNADGPRYRECNHLAFWDPVFWDDLNAALDARNQRYRRPIVNGSDPLLRRPRKRTRFPGQFARCSYCGHEYVWGGNGITKNLMCAGARAGKCWNSIGFDGFMAAKLISQYIPDTLWALRDFDEQFRALVEKASADGSGNMASRWKLLNLAEADLLQKKNNFLATIAAYGPSPLVEKGLTELVGAEHQLRVERHELERARNGYLVLPPSLEELRLMTESQFQQLAQDDFEFGYLLRQLLASFNVYLVRLVDGGHLLPRARIVLNLSGHINDAHMVPELVTMLTREIALDLFIPPQRERIRPEVVKLAATGLTQRQIAQALGEKPKQAAVQRALDLHRLMNDRGLIAPYVIVTEPPCDYAKLRRHKRVNYRFEPLEGYPLTLP